MYFLEGGDGVTIMNTLAENVIEVPIENTADGEKSGSSNTEALDEQETSKASSESVSYTHLTLPTICSV